MSKQSQVHAEKGVNPKPKDSMDTYTPRGTERKIVTWMYRHLGSCDIVPTQNLQSLNFLLAPTHPRLVTDARIYARRFQLIKVSQGCIQFFLCPRQVFVFDCQCLLLVLSLGSFVFNVLDLGR